MLACIILHSLMFEYNSNDYTSMRLSEEALSTGSLHPVSRNIQEANSMVSANQQYVNDLMLLGAPRDSNRLPTIQHTIPETPDLINKLMKVRVYKLHRQLKSDLIKHVYLIVAMTNEI